MIRFIDVRKDKKSTYRVTEGGTHVFFLLNHSGKLVIDILARGAKVYIFGLFIGREDDSFELNTVQHHGVGGSMSDLLIKGVFFDKSRLLYEGLIRIDKKAQKSNAYQKNQNILMSSSVFVDSRPFLEILANDVRCTHGSTTGKIDESQMYYLETRGLDRKKAERLLLEGFIGSTFSTMREKGVIDETRALERECLSYL